MISVVGSLNMDLVTNVNRTPKVGETILGNNLDRIPGGKGANQAVAIARLEGQVAMIGRIGKDEFGEVLINSLKESKVNTQYIKFSNNSTGTAMIMVNNNGDNSIVVIPGANFELQKEDIDEAYTQIKKSNIVITQLEIPLQVVEYTFKTAKKLKKYTILNPAPAQNISDEIISSTDLLTPNRVELEVLSGKKISNDEDIIKAARMLIDKGTGELVVTLGEKGALYINKSNYKFFDSFKVKVIDTTGAGDSVNGALALAINEGKTMEEAIEFAMKVGALTTTKRGAQSSLPTLEAVNKFFK